MVCAQSVSYSSTVSNDINTRFEVIGKAGNFYWLYKTKKYNTYKNGAATWSPKEDRSFEVYDERLIRVKEIRSPLSDSVLKEYLVPQKASFDQLLFKKSGNKISVVVNRFAQDGAEVKNAHLFDFPHGMALEDILVTRSPDRTKILLLGFVSATNVTPDLHAKVYTGDWGLLHDTVYKEANLVQPFIQYDRTEYVRESSDATPIKILNNGDWLMVAPARLKNSHVLFHFKKENNSFVQVDMQQPKNAGIEYFSLSVKEGVDAYIGILENSTPTDKRLRMMQYSLIQNSLGYDTAYTFRLPNSFKNVEYQFEEEFIQIPGKGFMYVKEYGRQYFVDDYGDQIMLDDEGEYTAYANRVGKLKFNEDEYTRNSSLSDTKKKFKRGDLSVRYFPFHPADSCWGGLIHVEQATELRYANLSYACVPSGDKIVFLYNSLAKNLHKVSSTIILDHKGQAVDEGVIFWRPDRVLNFQKARLINPGELFVPFDRHGLQGFAIIRFNS
jgi:hypothetical protein